MWRTDHSPLIFVVDDDQTAILTLEGMLGRAGFRTASARDVAGALEGIRACRPDLVLLDVSLGERESGFDVCRSLQADSAVCHTPVLFISADDDIDTKVQGFEAGGVDYITKPISGAEVIARVRTHLRLRQAYERLAELQAERIQRLAAAQQNMMPQPEDFPEARFQVSLRQVLTAGGDFYDVIRSGGTVVDYLVADASGHDLAASFWTAALKALAAEYASPVNLPIEAVSAMNNALRRILPSGAFFTLIYARLNHQTGELTLVNAGHPPAIIVRARGTTPRVIRQEGDVLGAFSDAVFGTANVILEPGDRIFLYSDGLIETNGSPEEGIARLAAACFERRVMPLAEMVPMVAGEIAPQGSLQDDTVLLGVEL
jgi:sigma-B regulation protein RsbU (phosphoserine phosphatase)